MNPIDTHLFRVFTSYGYRKVVRMQIENGSLSRILIPCDKRKGLLVKAGKRYFLIVFYAALNFHG